MTSFAPILLAGILIAIAMVAFWRLILQILAVVLVMLVLVWAFTIVAKAGSLTREPPPVQTQSVPTQPAQTTQSIPSQAGQAQLGQGQPGTTAGSGPTPTASRMVGRTLSG
jgi:hypothetical protein